MTKWYMTFGQSSGNRNRFFVIEAETRMAAQEHAHRLWGREWSMMYSEDEFAGQPEKYGLTETKR